MSRKRAKQKKDKAKLVSINIWYRHTACVYKIVFNNLLVETLWKLLGRRTYSQRVVSFTDKFLFAFCFSVWQHYGNHVSICWFKLKLERFPKNPVLFLNKAVVPKAIYCFVSVFFYPSTVCIMRDRVLRKSYRKVSAIAQRKKNWIWSYCCAVDKKLRTRKTMILPCENLKAYFLLQRNFDDYEVQIICKYVTRMCD